MAITVGSSLAPSAHAIVIRPSVDLVSREILATEILKIDQGSLPGADPSRQIHKNFSQLVEQNVARLDPLATARLFDGLSDGELADLAQLYTTAITDTGRAPRMLALFAQRLDGVRLGRASKHFGFAAV